MAKKDRMDKAQEKVLGETCMEYVTDVYEAPDFVQVCGMAGGDCVCYRVYDNGEIFAK